MSSETIVRRSYGEVTKPETINWAHAFGDKAEIKVVDNKLIVQNINRDSLIDKHSLNVENGLFCSKIFGPIKDLECLCGRYRGIEHKGTICNDCLVEVTYSRVTLERFGHIKLAAPVIHPWFKDMVRHMLGLSLDEFEKVRYFESYIVIDSGDTPLKSKQLLEEKEYRKYAAGFGGSVRIDIGARAIKKLLNKTDIRARYNELQQQLANDPFRDIVATIINQYSHIAKGSDEILSELFVLNAIPVLPAGLRAPFPLNSLFETSDLNSLYRRLITRNNRLERLLQLNAPRVIIRNEKRMLQEAVDALFDNGSRSRVMNKANKRPLTSLSDLFVGRVKEYKEKLTNPDFIINRFSIRSFFSASYSKMSELNQVTSQQINGRKDEIKIDLATCHEEVAAGDLAREISSLMFSLCIDASRIRSGKKKGSGFLEEMIETFIPYVSTRIDSYSYCATQNEKAKKHFNQGQYDEAINCYELTLSLDQTNIETLFAKGNCLMSSGRYLDAINCYDKIVQIGIWTEQAWLYKGLAYSRMGAEEEAIHCYDEALEIDSEYVSAWINKGVSLCALGRHTEAILSYNKVLVIDPGSESALFNKGIAYYDLGRYYEALKCYDSFLKMNPNNAAIWFNKALALEDQLSDGAKKHLTKEEKRLHDIFNGPVSSLKDILNCYNTAIKVDPQFSKAIYRKGITLYRLKRTISAIHCFEKALEIDFQNYNIWYFQATVQDELRWNSKAVLSFKKFLGLSPDSLEMESKIKYALQRLGEIEIKER